MSLSRVTALLLAASLAPTLALARGEADHPLRPETRERHMSSMGGLAAQVRRTVQSVTGLDLRGACLNQADCPDEDTAGPAGGQAETSIAVDETGQHVVVGYNDTRGFFLPAISVSGVMYSDDGGKTFVDGGQLPTPGDQVLSGQRFPQVFGDPEVKHLGGCGFAYFSIMLTVKELQPGVPTAVQTLSVHRSRDCGHTWEGPFEVTGASNPNGYVYSDGSAVDAADKEFADWEPGRHRALVSWTNFTNPALAPGGVQISTTYSDDLLTATPPTWSTRAVVSADASDGQASIPRFGPGGTAYVSWRRFPFPGTYFGYGNTTAFARSTDGGATWQAPIETAPEFFTMDYVLGNDRVNTSPSLAVDRSLRRSRGNLYLVYADNDSGDGADIAFQRSTDGGRSFSPTVFLNARPGDDRPQWFPWVTVDDLSGRVYAFWYDQGVAGSGDLMQVSYAYSDDAGRHWSAPTQLSSRPFHAGWGNDTGQPNLGDYIQGVVRGGRLYAAYAQTQRPPGGFVDGQPATQLTVPDVAVTVLGGSAVGAPPLDLQGVDAFDFGFTGHDGAIGANEAVGLTFTLRNAVTNPLSADSVDRPAGVLTTSTPGVKVLSGLSAWPDLDPGAAAGNRVRFVIFTTSAFAPGTPIELALTVRAPGFAPETLQTTLFTGTPSATPLLATDFEAPDLASIGWRSVHGAGANTVPWVIDAGAPGSPGFCGSTSRGVFHADAIDGPAGKSPSRWERLISPTVTVPADSAYVTVDFDVCTDTEDDPNMRVLAYDGLFLRVTDVTPGHTLRSVLVEAFQDEFTTGDLLGYPKHLPRSSDPAYFEDMSAWAGDSAGKRHVHLRLPGMAGTQFQLRFEYAQDGAGTCADVRPGHACGVLLDDVKVASVAVH